MISEQLQSAEALLVGNPFAATFTAVRTELAEGSHLPRQGADVSEWVRWLEASRRAVGEALAGFMWLDLAAVVGAQENKDSEEAAARALKELSRRTSITPARLEVGARAGAVTRALRGTAGSSPAMQHVRRRSWSAAFGKSLADLEDRARMIRRTPVLIHGATGTGKELIAKAIALAGPGKWDPSKRSWTRCHYEPIHLGSIPKDLVQDALFGHEPGAFSGAKTSQPGVLERCHGGTVFLDEIAELPHQTQVALLRCLQEGKVRRLGSSNLRPAAPRVISATHEDLAEAVADGRFRADVLQRLRSVQISIPALRDRTEDLEELAIRLIEIEDVGSVQSNLLEEVRGFLAGRAKDYDWPGNVRELAACVRSIGLGIEPDVRLVSGQGRSGLQAPRRAATPEPEGYRELSASLEDVKCWYAASVADACSSQVEAAKRLRIARTTLRGLLAKVQRD